MDNDLTSTVAQPVTPGAQPARIWRMAAILLSLPACAGCLLIVALTACTALGVMLVRGSQAQVEQSKPVIDEFMAAMAARDTGSAYALFSTRARESISRGDLETMLAGSNFGLFEGYQRMDDLEGLVGFTSDTDELAPQGWVVQVSGSIYYADGFIGRFYATLEREGDTWRLYGIEVTVPPEKLIRADFPTGGPGAGGPTAE